MSRDLLELRYHWRRAINGAAHAITMAERSRLRGQKTKLRRRYRSHIEAAVAAWALYLSAKGEQ